MRFTGPHSARNVLSWLFRVVIGAPFWFALPLVLLLCFPALGLFFVELIDKIDFKALHIEDSTNLGFVVFGVFIFLLIASIIIRIITLLNKLFRQLRSLFLSLGSLFFRLIMFSFRGFVGFVNKKKEVHVRDLAVDESGLTIRRTLAKIHIPWRDISQIGMLQLERVALNHRLPATQYTRADVLVVRLRPEVPIPDVVSVLSDEHRQLGYLGLCTLESVGCSRQEMASALERFAGGKLVHNSRQFLDRDPRLRPEMV
jgi:hypothetical protein